MNYYLPISVASQYITLGSIVGNIIAIVYRLYVSFVSTSRHYSGMNSPKIIYSNY